MNTGGYVELLKLYLFCASFSGLMKGWTFLSIGLSFTFSSYVVHSGAQESLRAVS